MTKCHGNTVCGNRCKRGISQRALDRPSYYCKTHYWQSWVYNGQPVIGPLTPEVVQALKIKAKEHMV